MPSVQKRIEVTPSGNWPSSRCCLGYQQRPPFLASAADVLPRLASREDLPSASSAGTRRRQCFSVTLKTASTDEGGFAKYPYSYPFLCLFEVGPGWNEVDGMEKMRRRRRKRRRRRRTRRRWMMRRRRMLWKSCMKESSEKCGRTLSAKET